MALVALVALAARGDAKAGMRTETMRATAAWWDAAALPLALLPVAAAALALAAAAGVLRDDAARAARVRPCAEHTHASARASWAYIARMLPTLAPPLSRARAYLRVTVPTTDGESTTVANSLKTQTKKFAGADLSSKSDP